MRRWHYSKRSEMVIVVRKTVYRRTVSTAKSLENFVTTPSKHYKIISNVYERRNKNTVRGDSKRVRH